MPIGYQHYMTIDGEAFPYLDQSIEEAETPFIDDDTHTGLRWGTTWTRGPIRYTGTISVHTTIANLGGLKNWAILGPNNDPDNCNSYVNIYTGDRMYGYDLKVGSITYTGNAEGQVDSSINVYGIGRNADRTRINQADTTAPPDMSGYNYDPLPWYLSSWNNLTVGAASGFTWDTSEVTAWSVTINNNEITLPVFDGYLVPWNQQPGILTVEGSFTLYNSAGIVPPPSSLDWFGATLDLTQSQTNGVFASPSLYLTFVACVPTAWPDAGAARGAKKTLTINWTGRGTYTAAPVA